MACCLRQQSVKSNLYGESCGSLSVLMVVLLGNNQQWWKYQSFKVYDTIMHKEIGYCLIEEPMVHHLRQPCYISEIGLVLRKLQ